MRNRHSLLLLLISFIVFNCSPKYEAHFTKTDSKVPVKKKIIVAQESPEIAQWIAEEVVTEQEVIEEVDKTTTASTSPTPVVIEKELPSLVTETSTTDLINSKSIDRANFRKEIKAKRKAFRSELKKKLKEAKKHHEDEDYVLMMVLAFLIPPLGVGLTYGIEQEFWISLILTLLFFLPGAIYSLIMVHKFFKG